MSTENRGAVVVTGASTGIGAACALHLDAIGFRVFAGVRKEADGAALEAKASERLSTLFLDVTDAASIDAARQAVADAVGGAGLAGLVNNAGVSINAPLEFLPIDLLRKQLEINVTGQIAVTQAFMDPIRAATGRIVIIGSTSGRLSIPMGGPYCASKFAIEALTDSLRMELKPWRIEVALVQPGAIDTPIWEKSLAAGDELLASLPPRMMELYGPLVDKVKNGAKASARGAVPAQLVADCVAHALTAPKPKTRYLVGKDSRVQMLLTHLPDRWRDALILKMIEKAI
ncbi:MAG: SDR family NAD(P)-dependent oxidoreductase [Candidatus Hydrogenedentes bacterium]|nr:SDR family NAD(P)-dependent oxidoreductase [Candidatus Hydrogenedentota bacterium]